MLSSWDVQQNITSKDESFHYTGLAIIIPDAGGHVFNNPKLSWGACVHWFRRGGETCAERGT